MMKFNYDNKIYRINYSSSINTLLAQGELLELPLSAWYEMLKEKDGIYPSGSTLLNILEAQIKAYDISNNVNGFIVNGIDYWLNKYDRVSLANLANSSENIITLVLGDQILEIPVDIAKQFLAQLEVYAGQCYLTTAKHLLAIKELKTIEDIISYDYTKGYPEKINFNV